MFKRKPLWTALAVVTILAVALSLTPVRAWASDFLRLFRVEKITVVEFDPQAAERAGDSLSTNREAIERVFDQYLEITEDGEVVEVSSVEEAAAAAGFTPRVPAAFSGASLAVKPGMQARFTIDQPLLQDLANTVGVEVELPREVDGKVISAQVPAAVLAVQGCTVAEADSTGPEKCTSLIQLPSPTVDAPEGLDMARLGQAMFRFLGMPEDQAAALSQRIDWATTLVLPVPQGKGFQVSDLEVDGVTGTFTQHEDEEGYVLLWVKDGILYTLRGPGGAAEALQIAGSLP